MKVTLADTVISVEGWDHTLDSIGEFVLKIRKTPEELRNEKNRKKSLYGTNTKVDPLKYTKKTVFSFSDDNSTAYFLPGFWPRVKNELESRNIKYTVEDLRNPDIRPDLDTKALEGIELRDQQDLALALIAKLDCGIIETTTGWGKSFVISLLCKALPTLNIVVTTSSSTVVATLYEYLNKQLPGEVGYLYARGNTTQGKRVVVTTLKSLPNINPEKVNLLLCDECHSCGCNEAGNAIMKFCFARRFGFSASPVRNDGSRKMLEALFGPVILKVSYQEAVDSGMVTPMKYTMLTCNKAPSICYNNDIPDVVLKRFSYWRNYNRNKAIKDFVCKIKEVYDGQILIMTETLEHAICLHTMLPWFKVASYGKVDIDELRQKFPHDKYPKLDLEKYKMTQKQLDIMRSAFAKGSLRYIISTMVMKQGVNFPHLSVLIRCDGAVSAIEGIQIPGRLSRLAENKDFGYLIDIKDTFTPWAASRAERREKLYNEQEWIKCTQEEIINDLRARTKIRDI